MGVQVQMKEELGWRPETGFEEMVEKMVRADIEKKKSIEFQYEEV